MLLVPVVVAVVQVSGQLHAEAFASAMSKVYTFGPTFRAEVWARHWSRVHAIHVGVSGGREGGGDGGLPNAHVRRECYPHCSAALTPELEHVSPPRRVLDDRAGDRLCDVRRRGTAPWVAEYRHFHAMARAYRGWWLSVRDDGVTSRLQMRTAEGCVKASVRAVLDTNLQDMEFFRDRVDKDCVARAENTVNSTCVVPC